MTAPLLYLTGTNTSVGKTTLASLLLRRAHARNLKVGALKPFCSGGREDAERLHALQTASLSLSEVNPFYFDEPVAPYVAARNQNQKITLDETTETIRKIATRHDPLLIEGAGGLMSPLGERFTLADIIRELPGRVCVVASNILGVINSTLLTHRALDSTTDARYVLMNSREPDASARSNADVIREWTGAPVYEFPFLPNLDQTDLAAEAVLDSLLNWWLDAK